jgi:hypothetical protein
MARDLAGHLAWRRPRARKGITAVSSAAASGFRKCVGRLDLLTFRASSVDDTDVSTEGPFQRDDHSSDVRTLVRLLLILAIIALWLYSFDRHYQLDRQIETSAGRVERSIYTQGRDPSTPLLELQRGHKDAAAKERNFAYASAVAFSVVIGAVVGVVTKRRHNFVLFLAGGALVAVLVINAQFMILRLPSLSPF